MIKRFLNTRKKLSIFLVLAFLLSLSTVGFFIAKAGEPIGTLTVIKEVINQDGANFTASEFTIHVGGADASPSTFSGSAIGTAVTITPFSLYSVTEDAVAGCTTEYSCDCSGAVISGGSATCTITNTCTGEGPQCTENFDCDDGDICNGLETCIDNSCQSGAPLTCDDQNVCTDDNCDPISGCVFTPNTDPCDDGNTCTTDDVCVQGICLGAPMNCSQYNISAVGTCDFDPDNNIFTWDFRNPFNSICIDPIGCTTGDETITHTCSVNDCQATCDAQNPCPDTICNDGCQGNDYYNYDNVANTCQGDCTCTDNSCGEPIITYNASACTACQTNEDCNDLDEDYCEGTIIMHDEGICVDFICIAEPIPGIDCDDGLYCNGQEGCSNAICTPGTDVDCSDNDIDGMGTCGNIPDDNPFTWDFFGGFISTCNEDIDSCTTGAVELTHTCDAECDAECIGDEDCNDEDETTIDACNLTTCGCEYTPIEEPYCGDDYLDEGEQCDDGNNIDEGCSPACESSCSYCSANCTTATLTGDSCGGGGGGGGGGITRYCGDGLLHPERGEECDDRNTVDGDGCSSTCKIEEVLGEIIEEEEEMLGEVLGTTTELPETGQDPSILIFAGLLVLFGLGANIKETVL